MTENPSQTSNEVQVCDLLIHNAHIFTMDPQGHVFSSGAIAVGGSTILAVGTNQDIFSRFRGKKSLDAQGGPVHPGFIDTHNHISITTIRGLLREEPSGLDPTAEIHDTYHTFVDFLQDDDEYASTLLTSAELLLGGFTTVIDPGTVFEPEVAADAMKVVGIRGSLGEPYLQDRQGVQNSGSDRTPISSERCERLLGNQLWRNEDTETLVRGHVALYGMGGNTPEFTTHAIRYAKEKGVAFTQHQSTSLDDFEDHVQSLSGTHPFVYYADQGLLNGNCEALNFVHCNVIKDDEITPISESGLSITWQPYNPLYYAVYSEIPCRMPELYQAGINITLCNDVNEGHQPGDMTLLAYLVGRNWGNYLSVENLFEMSTINAARAIGMEDLIGSIEPGKRADIVLRRRDLTECYPERKLLQAHLIRARSKSVDTVLVDGRIVVMNGNLETMDEQVILELIQASTKSIAIQMGI